MSLPAWGGVCVNSAERNRKLAPSQDPNWCGAEWKQERTRVFRSQVSVNVCFHPTSNLSRSDVESDERGWFYVATVCFSTQQLLTRLIIDLATESPTHQPWETQYLHKPKEEIHLGRFTSLQDETMNEEVFFFNVCISQTFLQPNNSLNPGSF